MIKKFFSTLNFSKKTADQEETPIIDELVKQGVNYPELKRFLDQYGHVLIKGAAFEAFELHRSKEFPKITNTTEALNEGQQCLSTFLKRFYREANVFKGKVGEENVWMDELNMSIKDE